MKNNTTKQADKQSFKDKLTAQQQTDLSNHNNSIEKIQAKLKEETLKELTWNDNQVSYFLDNQPPDITGLCSKSGWTFPLGETSLLIAQGGTGKSYFLLGLMVALATGTPYGEFKPKKRNKVLGLFGEDSKVVLHTRTRNIIKALGLDKDLYRLNDLNKNFNALSVINMRLVEYGDHQNPIFTENFSLLRDFLAKEKAKGEPVDVLILDPLIRFYGLNENDNQHAAFFVDTVLGALQKEFNLSIIIAHHVPKSASKGFTALTISDIEQISPRGASAFLDNCRYALAMMKVSQKEAKKYGIQEQDYKKFVAIKPIKNNYTGETANPSFLRRNDQGVLTAANPQKDLNEILEEELYSCIEEYYNGDSIEVTTESTRGKVKNDSIDLPPKADRPKLYLRDLTQNASKNETVKKVVEIIHQRLKNTGMKNIQKEIGARLVNLIEKGLLIKNPIKNQKVEILLKER
jgi:replicative DNA helicase